MPRNNQIRRKPRKFKSRSSDINRLPALNAIPCFSVHARYFSTTATTAGTEQVVTINTKDLINSAGMVATGTHALASYAQSCRIKSVDIWANYNSSLGLMASSPCSIGLVWFDASSRTRTNLLTDTTLSTATPARVHAVPPKTSFPAMWFDSNLNQAIFDIITTGPNSTNVNVVVDVHLEYTLSNQSYSPNTFSALSTTLNVGLVYYTPLDGITGAFLRQGLPQCNA